ncbi:hypothetical protein AAFF_G00387490 [Aldrovandia affinis]|uniref:Zinc transporter 10 n=1 Tax=Aldrovandia affinis TaxID=143900 RepID=A0AAD7SF46_9TELE|nr:hypothetical protein AAFF_G00387490 [Aldrovandia affinis]
MGRYSGKTCRLIFMLVLTVVFFVAEIVAGYMGNSIALVSDSFNMLSDLLSLCVGLTAARVSRRAGSGRYTYGLHRAEVVGALANAVFLAALCFSISVEAMQRLARPEAIADPGLGWRAAEEITAKSRRDSGENGEAGAPVLHDATSGETGQEKDGQPLNIQGVLLHVLNDALGSVVVVVASTLFYVWPLGPEQPCTWQCYVDPSLTLLMMAIIMSSAAPLVKETAGILLQMSPPELQLSTLLEDISRIPGVQSVHEFHVWELSRGRNVATLHVRCADPSSFGLLSHRVREVFHLAGVHSVTIQPEFGEGGDGPLCRAPCLSPACQSRSCCSVPPPAPSRPATDTRPRPSRRRWRAPLPRGYRARRRRRWARLGYQT